MLQGGGRPIGRVVKDLAADPRKVVDRVRAGRSGGRLRRAPIEQIEQIVLFVATVMRSARRGVRQPVTGRALPSHGMKNGAAAHRGATRASVHSVRVPRVQGEATVRRVPATTGVRRGVTLVVGNDRHSADAMLATGRSGGQGRGAIVPSVLVRKAAEIVRSVRVRPRVGIAPSAHVRQLVEIARIVPVLKAAVTVRSARVLKVVVTVLTVHGLKAVTVHSGRVRPKVVIVPSARVLRVAATVRSARVLRGVGIARSARVPLKAETVRIVHALKVVGIVRSVQEPKVAGTDRFVRVLPGVGAIAPIVRARVVMRVRGVQAGVRRLRAAVKAGRRGVPDPAALATARDHVRADRAASAQRSPASSRRVSRRLPASSRGEPIVRLVRRVSPVPRMRHEFRAAGAYAPDCCH